MQGKSRGPEPPAPKRVRRPCQGAASSEISQSRSVSGATFAPDDGSRQEKSDSATEAIEMERLRAGNARRVRLEAELRRVYRGGALLFAELLGAEGLLLELA